MHSHPHDSHKLGAPQSTSFNRAFLISVVANGGFVVIQIIFAILTNSTSLLADGVHNLGDVLSLALAWAANVMLNKKPSEKATFGLKKTTILAAFANGALLIFTCGIIATEAVYKLFSPSHIEALGVMVVAGVGVLINGATALLFIKGGDDLNIKGAFLHLWYDALISVGVVVSAGIIYLTGWFWMDPLVGLLIALIILKGTWSLFRDSFRLMIDGVPIGISVKEVKEYLENVEGVKGLHELHIWALSTQENALSVHLWMPEKVLTDLSRQNLTKQLKLKFNIHHATIQIEQSDLCGDDVCSTYL